MANPWTKKNPFMSMWLSGANAATSRARGYAAAEAKRQQTAITKQATRLWTSAWLDAVTPKRSKKRAR